MERVDYYDLIAIKTLMKEVIYPYNDEYDNLLNDIYQEFNIISLNDIMSDEVASIILYIWKWKPFINKCKRKYIEYDNYILLKDQDEETNDHYIIMTNESEKDT